MRLLLVGLSIFCLAMGLITAVKGIELYNFRPDGTGIGIYFFGVEINDKVPNTDVAWYAARFLWSGIAFLLTASVLYLLSAIARKKTTSI